MAATLKKCLSGAQKRCRKVQQWMRTRVGGVESWLMPVIPKSKPALDWELFPPIFAGSRGSAPPTGCRVTTFTQKTRFSSKNDCVLCAPRAKQILCTRWFNFVIQKYTSLPPIFCSVVRFLQIHKTLIIFADSQAWRPNSFFLIISWTKSELTPSTPTRKNRCQYVFFGFWKPNTNSNKNHLAYPVLFFGISRSSRQVIMRKMPFRFPTLIPCIFPPLLHLKIRVIIRYFSRILRWICLF